MPTLLGSLGITPSARFTPAGIAVLSLLLALSCLFPAPVHSQTRLEARFQHANQTWFQKAQQDLHGADHKNHDGPHRKAGLDLLCLFHEHDEIKKKRPQRPRRGQRNQGPQPNPPSSVTPTLQSNPNAFIPIIDDEVLVEVACESEQLTHQVCQDLIQLGLRDAKSRGHLASGRLPIDQIQNATQIPGIRFLRPAYRKTNIGLVTSQGVAALNADDAALVATGFDGSGVTIGTLSDSYDTAVAPITNAVADVASLDLPTGIVVLDDTVTGTDEGRAMMQLIADVAPGADQQFHTAFGGQAAFAQGIIDLHNAGCDIIVDDVFYFAEPYFQDGVIAQAVETVVAGGALYFSSAGNSGRNSYEDSYRAASSVTGLGGGPLHDWDQSPGTEDVFQEFFVPIGSSVIFGLQWDQPFFSVSGGSGNQTEIDVYMTGTGAGQFSVFAGTIANNIGGDAVELFQFVNDGSFDLDGVPGGDSVFNLLIEHRAGPPPTRLKYIYFPTGTVTFNEYSTLSSTVTGHANAANALAVGAAAYFNTPAFGTSPPLLNSYSSAGGTPILFDTAGNLLASPEFRPKPEFVSVDGGNNTFFGSDFEPDGSPNFFGTSASAPHAAAVAALMLEKAGGPGSLTQAQVLAAFQNSAIDMNTPGFDDDSGAGFIDAEAAMLEVPLHFPLWQQLTFSGGTDPNLIDPDADPDNDGNTNAAEYYFGGDPFTPAGSPVVDSFQFPNLILTYTIAKQAPINFLNIETSSDLVTWTPLLTPPVPVADLGDRIQYELTIGVEPTKRAFARFLIPTP
ncbi:MAG: S8 family serine peptidase [Verrucomicrobiota bacterium]